MSFWPHTDQTLLPFYFVCSQSGPVDGSVDWPVYVMERKHTKRKANLTNKVEVEVREKVERRRGHTQKYVRESARACAHTRARARADKHTHSLSRTLSHTHTQERKKERRENEEEDVLVSFWIFNVPSTG